MIGQNIRKFRTEKQMTQKDLADQLFVSSQAVSRWENDEVEPSVSTVTMLAKIFGITCDELMGIPASPESETPPVAEPQYVIKEAKPVLALCENCNTPIFDTEDICRENKDNRSIIRCRRCSEELELARQERRCYNAKKKRIASLAWGIPVASVWLAISLSTAIPARDVSQIIGAVLVGLFIFTLIACCKLDNNFIGDMFEDISSFGFQMPGLIFELDLDGILWFLTVKLIGFLLSLLVSLFCLILAIVLCGFLSLFTFPFALVKNIKHPEDYDFDY